MRTNNHTMKAITLHLGLDVLKDSITIAIAEPGHKGELRLFGTITNDIDRLEKALSRIRKAHSGAHLEVAGEAMRDLCRSRTELSDAGGSRRKEC
jgi:hypothetical protein